jgi:D-aspartate ligase
MHRATLSELPPIAVFADYWAPSLAFARSLGARGVPLHFYGRGAGCWSRYCTRTFPCPPVADSSQFEPWLLEKIRSGKISRIAPTTDLIAYYISKFRQEFPADVARAIAPLSEIETCLIKTRFAHVCNVGGNSALATFAPDNLDQAIEQSVRLGFPVMLKPKSHLVVGFAERGVVVKSVDQLVANYRPYAIAPGQEALAEIYPELRRPLIQAYVTTARHRVYSVSGVKDRDAGVVACSVSYKREQWPPDVGISMVQVGCEDARILGAGVEVVDRLLSCGIFEIELLIDGDNLFAIDLNPRAFGFIALDIARGFDLPWLWYRTTMERVLPVTVEPSRIAFEARNTLLSFLYSLGGRRESTGTGPVHVGDPTRPRVAVPMLGHRSDPLPMAIAHLHYFKHPRSLLRNLQSSRVTQKRQSRQNTATSSA